MKRNGLRMVAGLCQVLLAVPASAQGIPSWRLTGAVEVGRDAPEGEFTRIAGITSLPDGSLVVADATDQRLRIFSADGNFLRAHGRRGQGPGEFQFIAFLAATGDSILVFESLPGQSRVTRVHAATGTSTRGPSVRGDPAFRGSVIGVAPSGATLAISSGLRPVQAPLLGESRTDSIMFGVGSTVGVTWLPPTSNRTWISYRQPQAVSGVAMAAHRLSGIPITGSTQRLVWIGDNGLGELRGFDASGKLQATVRWPRPNRPLDRADVGTYLTSLLAQAAPGDTARLSAENSLALAVRAAPKFQLAAESKTGELWIEEFRENLAAEGRVYVFDESGRALAVVVLPAGTRVRHVTRNVVVLTRKDDDGFERVLLYRVER